MSEDLNKWMGFIHRRAPQLAVELRMPPPAAWAWINRWNAEKARAYMELVQAMAQLVNSATDLDNAVWKYQNREKFQELMELNLELEKMMLQGNIKQYPLTHQLDIERIEAEHRTNQMQHRAAQAVLNDQIQEQKKARQAKMEQAVLDIKAREDRMKEMYRGMGADWAEGTKRWNDMVITFEKELEALFSDDDDI